MSAPDHTELFVAPLFLALQKTLVSDLRQATPALLGLVREPAQGPHASLCCMLAGVMMGGIFSWHWDTTWFCLSYTIKGTVAWEELLRKRICSTLPENPSRVCICWVSSIWRDVRLTHYLYSYSILIKALIKASDLLSGPSTEMWNEPSLSPSQQPLSVWSKPY